MAEIIVLGSLNMDLVAQVPRLPQPGETLTGQNFQTVPGGKGANQAVAAARLGSKVAMIGCVGDDESGRSLKQSLEADRIDTQAVAISPSAPSGTALIAVAPENNQIIVIPGANGNVGQQALQQLAAQLEEPSPEELTQDRPAIAKVLLLQLEIPFSTVEKAAKLAYEAGLIVVVDPAPAIAPLPDEFYQFVSILTPNQVEAELLTGKRITNIETARAAAQQLHQQGADTVIVKLGAQGIVGVSAAGSFTLPAFPVTAIDTVAAGDAFNGGLAAAMCQNAASERPSRAALQYASAVAAIAVTRPGAQTAMPTADAVRAFLSTHRKATEQDAAGQDMTG